MADIIEQTASKVVFFYNNTGYGWSEVWEYLGNATFDVIANEAKILAGLRLTTLGSSVVLKAIRITSNSPGARGRYVSLRKTKSDPPEYRTSGSATVEGVDYRNISVLVKCRGQNNHVRNWYMAAAPDLISGGLSEEIDSTKAPKWTDEAVKLGLYLESGKWGFRARKDPAGDFAGQNIVSMVYAAAPPLNVLVGVPAGGPVIAVGDTVQVKGAQKIDTRALGMNGMYRVVSKPAAANGVQQYELAGTTGRLSNQTAKLGQLYKVGYEYHSLQKVDYLKTVSRKRGVGGVVPRGRRRARERAILPLVTTS